jgi:hypothetical protein
MKKTLTLFLIIFICVVSLILGQESGYVDCEQEYGSNYICYTGQEWTYAGEPRPLYEVGCETNVYTRTGSNDFGYCAPKTDIPYEGFREGDKWVLGGDYVIIDKVYNDKRYDFTHLQTDESGYEFTEKYLNKNEDYVTTFLTGSGFIEQLIVEEGVLIENENLPQDTLQNGGIFDRGNSIPDDNEAEINQLIDSYSSGNIIIYTLTFKDTVGTGLDSIKQILVSHIYDNVLTKIHEGGCDLIIGSYHDYAVDLGNGGFPENLYVAFNGCDIDFSKIQYNPYFITTQNKKDIPGMIFAIVKYFVESQVEVVIEEETYQEDSLNEIEESTVETEVETVELTDEGTYELSENELRLMYEQAVGFHENNLNEKALNLINQIIDYKPLPHHKPYPESEYSAKAVALEIKIYQVNYERNSQTELDFSLALSLRKFLCEDFGEKYPMECLVSSISLAVQAVRELKYESHASSIISQIYPLYSQHKESLPQFYRDLYNRIPEIRRERMEERTIINQLQKKCKLIHGTGEDGKFNAVFIADGYDNLDTFVRDVELSIDEGIFENPLLNSLQNKFNFYYIDEINNICEPYETENGFISARCSGGEIIASACPHERIIILSKKEFRSFAFFGGLSATSVSQYMGILRDIFPIFYLSATPYDVVRHEMGHSFFSLVDEYVEPKLGNHPRSPNCAPDRQTAERWWGNIPGTGYYSGCSYVDFNIRSTRSSVMRISAETDFGPVNDRHIIQFMGRYS